MKVLGGLYNAIVSALAWLAGALLAAFTVGIVYDVTVRTLGAQPPRYTISLVEYGLLYVTMLGAPWLLRERGHVYVDMVVRTFSPRLRRLNELALYAMGIVVCAVLFYAALDLTIESYQRGDLDVREFDMPRWLIYLPVALSFLLLAIEFARYLFGNDTLYRDSAQPTERI